jgi:hypothetical protein
MKRVATKNVVIHAPEPAVLVLCVKLLTTILFARVHLDTLATRLLDVFRYVSILNVKNT